jgi:HK97 family phage portal protein
MGLIENLTAFFAGRGQKATGDAKRRNPTGYEVVSYGGLDLSTTDKTKFLEAMKGWVYACVSAIADEVGSIQLKLYKTEKNGEVVEVNEHKALDVLYKVNGFTTKFDHFWLTQAYLELAGESPWFVEKTNGEPSAIYFLRPDRITPKPDKQKVIQGYVYNVDAGEKINLNIDEVIFLKNPNPANPFRGKGTLESSARTVDIDNQAEDWNYKFFKNSARPDTVLTVKNMDQMEPEQKEKLKQSIREAHQGLEKSHNLMVLFADMSLEKFNLSQTDMDFVEQQKYARDKIMAMFRVPKAVIAQTEGVNFASAKTSIYTFSRFTIKPKMERIVQQLNEFYLPMFNDTENMFLDYESPVPTDREEENARYENALKNGWMTVNEVRAEQGLEPLEGFDVPYLPLNLYPVGGDNMPNVPTETNPEDLPNDEPKKEDEKDKEDETKDMFNYKNVERIRQMKARNRELFDFDEKVKSLESKIKKLVKAEIKKKGGKGKVTNKELNEIKKAIKSSAGLDKLKKKQKKSEQIKLVIVTDDRAKKEYEAKLKEIDEKMKHLKKLENDKIVENKKAKEERKKLQEIREQIIAEYNSQQDAE